MDQRNVNVACFNSRKGEHIIDLQIGTNNGEN